MGSERLIEPVSDNKDKQHTYAEMMARYKIAMRNGFYLEAMLIDYAIMEDRLRRFLYHIGALKNEGSYKLDQKQVKAELGGIVKQYKREKESDSLGIGSISGKIRIVRAVISWSAYTADTPEKKSYLAVLKDKLEGVDADALLHTLDSVSEWRAYRNEVIHGLLNKNTVSLHGSLYGKAEEGKRLAGELDSAIRKVKRGNTIRKYLRLPVPAGSRTSRKGENRPHGK